MTGGIAALAPTALASQADRGACRSPSERNEVLS
jgi:hypothetical protein